MDAQGHVKCQSLERHWERGMGVCSGCVSMLPVANEAMGDVGEDAMF